MTKFELTATICDEEASVAMVTCDTCGDETIDDGMHTRSWLRIELLGDLRCLGDYFGVERHFCSPACAVISLARVA